VCTLTKGAEKIATGTITVVCVTRGEDGVMKARSIPPEIAGRFEVSSEAEA
jgi:acyl-CoA thioesterase FadM